MKTISSFTGLITLFLFFILNAFPGSAFAIPKAPDRAGKARIVENYGKLPLSFEENQGQTDEKVGFLSRGGGYTLLLTQDEAVLALSSSLKDEGLGDSQKDASQVSRPEKQKMAKGAVIRMKFSGANTAPVISGQERLQETSNYFIGNDPSKWRTRISKYAKVRYREVYPGIDLVFYGDQRRLEYDFVVSPGSDPSKIRLEFQGIEEASLDENGNLVLQLKDGEVIQQAPVIYQEVDGRRVDVAGGYLIDHKGRVGCKVASWDRQRSLVIDPVLVYSTYLGGSSVDRGYGVAVDGSGNAYVTGGHLVFRKIITVDTLHLGSFLADLGDIIFDAADYDIWGLGNIRDVLCNISYRFYHPMCSGAVEDLTTEGCVDWLEDVYLSSHAVVGNKYIDTACLLLSLSDRIPEAHAKAAAKLFKIMEMILKMINPDWGCENWVNLLDVPTYTDYVVSGPEPLPHVQLCRKLHGYPDGHRPWRFGQRYRGHSGDRSPQYRGRSFVPRFRPGGRGGDLGTRDLHCLQYRHC